MKRLVHLFSLLAITCLIFGSVVWAQEGTDEFTLETITVTAEKRSVALQELPSSVMALAGDALANQGRFTTEEILETIPNITFRDGGYTNPNGNIAIRGIQRTQVAKGIDDVLPATTAVYVDGVYMGIGGQYDLSRVEILRGPQGTLYGRSATGGVVSFYTTDPQLKEFGGSVSTEVGSDGLVNVQGALNVPLGEKFAIRAAGHWYSRDGYFNPQGGHSETKEGRIKVRFQPNDAFDIVVHAAMQETVEWAGGSSAALDRSSPDTIIYNESYSDPMANPPNKYGQFGATANYDFGNSILTWVAGYHEYELSGMGAESARTSTSGGITYTRYSRCDRLWPTDYYHTEELRLASDTEGPFTWLVGANYFRQEFENDRIDLRVRVEGDPEIPEDMTEVIDRRRWAKGYFLNYGIFTEETFELQEDFRVTAGLRYDYTDFTQSMIYMANLYKSALGNLMSPEQFAIGELVDDKHEWKNITYKLRFEYDLTPDNMVYLTTATGFVPGFAAIGPRRVGDVIEAFEIRVLEEQKLTSYEFGTKNEFLDNRLRLNSAIFYYDVEGYPEVLELAETPGPGVKFETTTPVEVIGLDLEVEYMATMHDKFSLTAGYQKTELQGWEGELIWPSGTVTPSDWGAILREQPGHPKLEATLGYDHTFALDDGSMLVPRVELHYTGDYYLTQMTYIQENNGMRPFNHRDNLVFFNANVSWTSANQKYSVNGWVRNAFGEEYKADTGLMGSIDPPPTNIGVTPGNPRTYGLMVSVKF